ncbi:pantoate--beta-alanine ligase [Bacillus pakistanensis]|uniref:Pantothenate synthetase n=1 Tax=Rossellomorea pakistanensis TaxID=992288 RepID=A0ABS2N8Z0_9BACI|nr:pantoate--beta-alanine ligase [Bacillus pakistanensis]
MIVLKNVHEMKEFIKESKSKGKKIGFVPTMGFLHEGHLALVDRAKPENDLVVMSIFVNPLQFGPNEDFERYPRDEEHDYKLAKDTGVDVLFIPGVDDIYPKALSIHMTVKERVNVLCGKKREGHFDGVVTVLTKLFHIIEPDAAYFGLKDAQQVAVVEGLVEDFFFPIEIVRVPTVREREGLAKSSRNVYLSDQERIEAPVIYHSLTNAANSLCNNKGDIKSVLQELRQCIELNTSGIVEYVDAYTFPSLTLPKQIKGEILIAVAVQFKQARLIDNIIVDLG